MRLLRRFAILLRWRRFQSDLDEELRLHEEMTRAALGHSRNFGNGLLARNEARDVWLPPAIQGVIQDARFAGRFFVRDWRFSMLALFVLGLGIGANNMLFTILNAHTIRGLPIDQADRVLYVSTVDPQNRQGGMSLPDLRDVRASTQSFSSLAAFVNVSMTIGDEGRRFSFVVAARLSHQRGELLQQRAGQSTVDILE